MALNRNGTVPNPSSDLVVRKLPENWGLEDDDPMVPLLQANAQLEAKVEQWSTAILELAALARQQNQAMQETSQNSLRLTSALSSFEQESVQLRTLIKQLSGSLTESKGERHSNVSPELSQNALQTLMPLLNEIKAEVGEIKATIETNEEHQQAGDDSRKRLEGLMALQVGGFIGLLICGYGFYTHMTGQQALLWQQSSWMLTKLERIEKALGVEPGK
jgi:ABC-type transporter Mla subunit MlaD